MGRIFDPTLAGDPDEGSAEKSCEALDVFLKKIGLWLSLEDLGVAESEIAWIADHSLMQRTYRRNLRAATRDDIFEMLIAGYRRQGSSRRHDAPPSNRRRWPHLRSAAMLLLKAPVDGGFFADVHDGPWQRGAIHRTPTIAHGAGA